MSILIYIPRILGTQHFSPEGQSIDESVIVHSVQSAGQSFADGMQVPR